MKRKMAQQRLFLIVGLVVSVAISACTFAGVTQSVPISADRFPAKESSAPIEVLAERPTRQFLIVGSATAHADVGFYGLTSVVRPETAVENLKTVARKMGGDAIIDFSSHTAPVGSVGAGGITVQGTVIRWK